MGEVNESGVVDKAYLDAAFERLQSLIGETVTCIYWENGVIQGYRGVLAAVRPYDFVSIEGQIISFAGQRNAIQYIILQENQVPYSIYANPKAKNYKGSLTDIMTVVNSQRDILGVSTLLDELMEREETKKRKM